MMRINLPHTVEIVTPVRVTDSRGNEYDEYTVPPAESRTFKAWLQQDSSDEVHMDGRDPLLRKWSCYVIAPDIDMSGRERVYWNSPSGTRMTFEVWGPPAPMFTLDNGYSHTEMALRLTNG